VDGGEGIIVDIIHSSLILAVASGAIRAGTPLLLAGIGELVYERSGVINLGLEGIMLVGALSGVWGFAYFHDVFWAIMVAALTGALVGALHGFFCVLCMTNQIVTGLAFVIFFQGFTALFGKSFVGMQVAADLSINLPWIKGIPVIGEILGEQDLLVLISVMILLLTSFFLFHTRWGIVVRAVGEDARAAAIHGFSVRRVRMASAVFCGAMCGLAGAHMSVAYASQWQENMVAGRGWIALVLVILASWQPRFLLIGAYFFGGLTVLQLNLQAWGISISSYLLGMIPFVLTIIVLVFSTILLTTRPSSMPSDLGKPYNPGNL